LLGGYLKAHRELSFILIQVPRRIGEVAILYYEGFLFNPEHTDDNVQNAKPMFGVQTFAHQFPLALLEHGTFDAYLFPKPSQKRSAQNSERSANHEADPYLFSDSRRRIGYVSSNVPSALANVDNLVLVSPGPFTRRLRALRDRIGRPDIPTSGFIHSLNYLPAFDETCLELMQPFRPGDVIFTSSLAGDSAFHKRMQFVSENMRRAGWGRSGGFPTSRVSPLAIATNKTGDPQCELRRAGRAKIGSSPEEVILLFFGRLSATSKADLVPLLLAAREMRRLGDPVTLVIAGDDDLSLYSSRLETLIREWGLGAFVKQFSSPGSTTKSQLFAAADVFVAPSDSLQETFGLTLLEAMANSLPIVASDWSGYRDIVIHGETGFLVPTLAPDYESTSRALNSYGHMSSEDFLARTTVVDVPSLLLFLRRLAASVNLRNQMGTAGRLRFEAEYTWKQAIHRFEAIWLEMLAVARQHDCTVTGDTFDLSIYNPVDIFQSFPTRWCATAAFSPTEFGLSAVNDKAFMAVLCSPQEWFRMEIFSALLYASSSDPRFSVQSGAQLYEVLHASRQLAPISAEVVAMAHIFRLAKHNMICFAKESSIDQSQTIT
jgi:D-inositol-3-phosphate glycosyltransferase